MCSAASFDLIFVVMAESFTKFPGCERSVSESLSAITAVEANRAQTANVVSTIFDFSLILEVFSFCRRQTGTTILRFDEHTICTLSYISQK